MTQTSCQRSTQELVWYTSLSCPHSKIHTESFCLRYLLWKYLKLLITTFLDNSNIGLPTCLPAVLNPMPTKGNNLYCRFAIKETERNNGEILTWNTNQLPMCFSLAVFLEIEFGSGSFFSHIYLLIFINVPPVTSRDNYFEKTRKMALYYMICKPIIYISYCDLGTVIFCCQACIGLICAI